MSIERRSGERGSGGRGAGDADPTWSDGSETTRISSRCDEYHSTASSCERVRYRTHTNVP